MVIEILKQTIGISIAMGLGGIILAKGFGKRRESPSFHPISGISAQIAPSAETEDNESVTEDQVIVRLKNECKAYLSSE